MYLFFKIARYKNPIELVHVAENLIECQKYANQVYSMEKGGDKRRISVKVGEAFAIGRNLYLIEDEAAEQKRVLRYLLDADMNYRTLTNVREKELLDFLKENGVNAEIEHDRDVLRNTYLVKRR